MTNSTSGLGRPRRALAGEKGLGLGFEAAAGRAGRLRPPGAVGESKPGLVCSISRESASLSQNPRLSGGFAPEALVCPFFHLRFNVIGKKEKRVKSKGKLGGEKRLESLQPRLPAPRREVRLLRVSDPGARKPAPSPLLKDKNQKMRRETHIRRSPCIGETRLQGVCLRVF